ncbi:keratin, type I cytoskeletal 12-like [Pelobates cultripes]|uniref:Keratin, type I cytoskeletal 12-like n=1 Tax=Pelobates cultripes TaxID=61616 RepID=A0AAD1WB41_PELCU|nr:keratin, type I cytoskeletal 12-like [Pelobates cultripes]
MAFQSIYRNDSVGYGGTSRYSDSYLDDESRETTRRSSVSDEYMKSSRQNSNRSIGVGETSSGHFGDNCGSSFGGRSTQIYRNNSNSSYSGSSVGHRGSLQGSLEGIPGSGYSAVGTTDIQRSSVGVSGISGQGNENSVGTERESFVGSFERTYSNGSSAVGQRGHLGENSSISSVSRSCSGFFPGEQMVGFGDSFSRSSSVRSFGGSSVGGQRGGLECSFSGGSGGVFSGGVLVGGQKGDYGGSYSNVTFGGFSGSLGGGDSLLQGGEKETMQNLNTRLATYLDKVHALEEANSNLEVKIRQWYETYKPEQTDNSKYYKLIEELKEKIINATLDNNRIVLQVDNTRIASDDFRQKYETELCMRQNVEADLSRLRKMLDDLTLARPSLEAQIESLRDELTCIKKNHETEMKSLQKTTGDVTVQLDAAPAINILNILNDMRAQYEGLAEQNRQKAEADFTQKKHAISELNIEISSHCAKVESNKNEVTELRRTMQTLEIDLQSQIAMKDSLENTLAETEGRYCLQLNQIQVLIDNLQEQLCQFRSDMECQSTEYKLLLDIKTRLENEIEMYQRLLEGEGCIRTPVAMGTMKEKKSRYVTTIIEERVNGKVVSTKVDKIEQKL